MVRASGAAPSLRERHLRIYQAGARHYDLAAPRRVEPDLLKGHRVNLAVLNGIAAAQNSPRARQAVRETE